MNSTATEGYAESIIDTAREYLLLLSSSLIVLKANPAFCRAFEVERKLVEGNRIDQIGGGEWGTPELRNLLEAVIESEQGLRDYEVSREFDRIGGKTMLLNARRIQHIGHEGFDILLAIEDVTEARRVEDEYRRLHAELEDRVRERTAELAAANEELESFSYSVSHDLRSPLRGIEGYSRILLEEHAREMTEPVCGYVTDIRRNAIRMGRLIDDLLTLTRISRQGLQRRRVAPASIVQQAIDDLSAQRNGRDIDFVIGSLPVCEADFGLLKHVWLNLIDNAIKYTRVRSKATIEIGGERLAGGSQYWIRDNGVGFDMRYAGKLFNIFQRLHRASEYDGTGVGLAIVRRILEHHGGSIRVESETDRGACFTFTIPDSPNSNAQHE